MEILQLIENVRFLNDKLSFSFIARKNCYCVIFVVFVKYSIKNGSYT